MFLPKKEASNLQNYQAVHAPCTVYLLNQQTDGINLHMAIVPLEDIPNINL